MGSTLYYDDPFPPKGAPAGDFVFSDLVGKQHAVVFQYLGLDQTVRTLKETEFYFRRYPFRGLPVSRSDHITNICEMYFSCFYELKERLKNYFDALRAATPGRRITIGPFIKQFANEFEAELRARNDIHHHGRFEDIAIDHIFITGSLSTVPGRENLKRTHLAAYRKVVNEWARRARTRGARVDEFLDAVADVTLRTCDFLSIEVRPTS